MNDEAKLMEGEIIAEENLTGQKIVAPQEEKPSPLGKITKINPADVKTKLMNIKRPKFITILLIFVVLIVSFILLIVLSGQKPKEEVVDPDIYVTSPNPTPQISAELKQIYTDIDAYQKKVENLNDSTKNYQPPKVDLKVDF